MKRTFIIFFLLFTVSSVNAFDGNRKGFVFGGGGGINRTHNLNNNRTDPDIHYMIGYGFNEKNTLVLEGHNIIKLKDWDLIYGHGGIMWYHYYSNSTNSFYTVLGVRYIYEANFNIGAGILYHSNFQFGFVYHKDYEDDDWYQDWKLTVTYIGF
ncbi:MAG: hypothetical protein DWP97_09130 [Calditrichaeota bacterium]|nr:MAG: hypothetical protein DWP97_09130 [Calditrichota bacterium]